MNVRQRVQIVKGTLREYEGRLKQLEGRLTVLRGRAEQTTGRARLRLIRAERRLRATTAATDKRMETASNALQTLLDSTLRDFRACERGVRAGILSVAE